MAHPCPVCGREAVAVIPSRVDQGIVLTRLYRHEHYGRVWLHRIQWGE